MKLRVIALVVVLTLIMVGPTALTQAQAPSGSEPTANAPQVSADGYRRAIASKLPRRA